MIATLREGRYGVNSVFKGKNTDLNENRGPRRQSATRTTWRVPILVPWWWWWWSRGVAPLLCFSFRSRSVVDLTSSVVDAVVSSKRSSNAVLSFSSIITSFTSFWFWSSLCISDSRDDDPSCPRPSYDDGRLCSSVLLVTCVPCLPYVIQNQSGDSRLGQECFVIG